LERANSRAYLAVLMVSDGKSVQRGVVADPRDHGTAPSPRQSSWLESDYCGLGPNWRVSRTPGSRPWVPISDLMIQVPWSAHLRARKGPDPLTAQLVCISITESQSAGGVGSIGGSVNQALWAGRYLAFSTFGDLRGGDVPHGLNFPLAVISETGVDKISMR